VRRAYRAFARKLSEAEIPGSHFDAEKHIVERNPRARILVIGSGERQYTGDVTYTDVAFSRGVHFICDAHDLPFRPESFDAVFADAVLEHVCDPQRCVSEIVRVLKPDGYVMATTPFLQPVHMGAHDFTRFTHLGHRRLFRRFDEIESGMSGGPMYSAIHVFRNLVLSVSDRPRLRALIRLGALLVTYPLRHLDPLFSRTESAYNSACAFYFFGRKRATAISDREIIGMFRGR
jgi:SAM-dependent methyltransferase